MKKNKHWLGVYAVLLASACASLWLNQQSIETYWQQQYHRASPLARLQGQPWWQWGRAVREQIDTNYQYAENRVQNWSDDALVSLLPMPAVSTTVALAAKPLDIAQIDISPALAALEQYATDKTDKYAADKRAQRQRQQATADNALRTAVLSSQHRQIAATAVSSSVLASSSESTQQTANAQKAQQSSQPPSQHSNQSATTVTHSADKITLKAGDNVLFIGDSMMQSFAPKMQKWLKKQHNVNSINMGRHSTGLTNQGYFDWPKKAEASIKAKKNLKLVVVFLGANDAWNMKVSKKVLRFNSPQWVNAYSERMMRIVRAAQAKNAQVIWIGLPYMRSKKYSKKIVALDNIMRQALKGNALYIPIRNLLGGKNQQYRDSLKINGKWRRVRHKDGIHLNAQGELKVLEAIKPYIHFE